MVPTIPRPWWGKADQRELARGVERELDGLRLATEDRHANAQIVDREGVELRLRRHGERYRVADTEVEVGGIEHVASASPEVLG